MTSHQRGASQPDTGLSHPTDRAAGAEPVAWQIEWCPGRWVTLPSDWTPDEAATNQNYRALYVAQTASVHQPREITEEDRQYASELMADLANLDQGLSRRAIAEQWFRKARVEHSLCAPPDENASPDAVRKIEHNKPSIETEGLTGREHDPWLCHVTPNEVYTTSNRILDLIQESDPLGDRITQHELLIFSQAFADLGRSQALYRFQHGLDDTGKDRSAAS